MSWWDTGLSNFANQATQALAKAQEQIDKVLDIKEDGTSSSSTAQEGSASPSSLSKSKQTSSPGLNQESGGDDSFWNSWLPDSGQQTKKPGEASASAPSTSTKEGKGPEEKKAVSKLDSMIQSRKKASEKLGLRKSRKKSNADEEKTVTLQKSQTEVVQKVTETVVKTSSFAEIKSEVENKVTSGDSKNTDTKSSFTEKESQQEPLKSDTKEDIGADRLVLDSSEPVKEPEEVKHVDGAQDESPKTKAEKEIISSKDDQNFRLEDHGAWEIKEEVSSLSESVGSSMKDDACSTNDLEGKHGIVETEKKESVEDKLVISLEDSTNFADESESWGQDLMDVDLSLVEQVESEENPNREIEPQIENVQQESKAEIDLSSAERESDENPNKEIEPQIPQIEIVPEENKVEVNLSSNEQGESDEKVEEKIESETENFPQEIKIEDSVEVDCGSAAVHTPTEESCDESASIASIKTENNEKEFQETVIEPQTAEENVVEEKIGMQDEQDVQKIPDDILGVVEPMADSLSDSKSEGSVVEKVQMQISTESGTTTSEETDEYNRTLTEEDFKKMAEVHVESKTDAEQSDKDQTKTSPEHTGTTSLTSSGYVKNMIEEAMVESLKESDSHSDRSSDKSSDMVRIESGMNSGHTSGDEIDTTTSSDIEIISTPTPNGEYKIMERPFDLSPLRHALSKTVRRGGSPPGHKRSDSGSSAHSNWSKNGDDLLSPEGMVHKHEMYPSHTHAGAECHEGSNPLETEKLLKEDSGTNKPLQPIAEKYEPLDQTERTLHVPPQIHQKLADMAEVIEHRERKLVEMSKQNIDLQESNSILRNQLQQSEESREAEMADLNEITNEFTERLSESEKKLNQVLREKEAVKKQLDQARNELYKTTDVTTSAEKLLREKDLQITELMEEGEKLMKQQLQTNNILKKLRAKEKETDSTNKSQKEKLQKQKVELEHLQKVLDAKEELEKKQIEAINQLNNAVKRQDMEINRLTSDLEDAQEKSRSMQVILDNSYKEMAELHKANAAKNSEAQQVALSTEMQAKEEIRLALERQQFQSKHDQEALVTQIEDLRLSITRMEKESGRREDVLRQEISDLQQRLQEAEGRNQELTQSISAATKPLLRQIENIQATYTAQTNSYEKVEKNLTDRLAEAQTQLASAVEKERIASEKVIDINARLTSLESQVGSLRQEKSRLSAELEMERAKAEVLEEAKLTESAQFETAKHTREREISEVKKEKVLLENQLEMEKMRVEAEKKKLLLAHEQLREKELLLERRSPSPGLALSRTASVVSDSSMSTSFTQDEILEKTLMVASANGNKTSLYESLRNTSAASLLENLQSQLKQKEGEITQLQSEIGELERTRESMARELVNLTTENEKLQDQVNEYPEFQSKYKEMDGRYQALLQMYGEKVEETEELRLDLQDVKDMYKAQIDELLKNR